MRRKRDFGKLKSRIASRSLTFFLILLLTVVSFEAKYARDVSPSDKGGAYEKVASTQRDDIDANWPMYRAPLTNISLIGVIPNIHGQWIASLIGQNIWKTPSRVGSLLLLCYPPKWPEALLSHCHTDFLADYLGSMKIRE